MKRQLNHTSCLWDYDFSLRDLCIHLLTQYWQSSQPSNDKMQITNIRTFFRTPGSSIMSRYISCKTLKVLNFHHHFFILSFTKHMKVTPKTGRQINVFYFYYILDNRVHKKIQYMSSGWSVRLIQIPHIVPSRYIQIYFTPLKAFIHWLPKK